VKKPPFIDAIRAETARTREELAAIAFALDTVRAAIREAAGKALEEIRVAPPGPLDLRGTKAAAGLVKHLQDSGFRVDWDTRLVEQGGHFVTSVELVVDWRKPPV
jgi:hypothetical protein